MIQRPARATADHARRDRGGAKRRDVDPGDPRFYLADPTSTGSPSRVRLTPVRARPRGALEALVGLLQHAARAVGRLHGLGVLIEADETPSRVAAGPGAHRPRRPRGRPVVVAPSPPPAPRRRSSPGRGCCSRAPGSAATDSWPASARSRPRPLPERDRLTVVLPSGGCAQACADGPGRSAGSSSACRPRRMRASPRTSRVRARPEVRPADGGFAITVANAETAPDGTVSADVTVGVRPGSGPRQRVTLLLSPLRRPAARGELPGARPSRRRRRGDGPGERRGARDHLVRVQVDGAESPLARRPTARFDAPTVTLP